VGTRDFDAKLDEFYTSSGPAESIVIMPDGESLWYADDEAGTPWRSMFINELIPQVDSEYRTLASRDYRGLSGVSMGGFGAYSIGLAHPELFSSLASHIGALNVAPSFFGIVAPGGPAAQPRSPIDDATAMSADVLSTYDYYFDACEEDDYAFDNAARGMDTALTTKGVKHTWAVYPEGRHNDACWMPHIADSFGMHSDHQRAAGLQEEWVAPELVISTEPADANEAGWFRSSVTVTATATDADDDGPMIEFTLDGSEWSAHADPIVISGDGVHTLEMRARYAAGNTSPVKKRTVFIHNIVPQASAVFDAKTRTLTLTGTDAGARIAGLEYTLGEQSPEARIAFTAYTDPIVIGADATVVNFRAVDASGNEGAVERLDIVAATAVPPAEGGTTTGGDTPGAGVDTPRTQSGSGSLAQTGMELGNYPAMAALLLALGAGLLVLRRRRILGDATRRVTES
jgi:LPXTG-motif cell wall-anchored protein